MTEFVRNKKVFFDYEVLETIEAGIELQGFEVKSVKNGKTSLDGSYVAIRGGEAFLIGASIAPYQVGNTAKDYDDRQARKILITKKEIADLSNTESKKGLTIVPISMYSKGRRIKVSIAVVKGKKKFDKREDIKKREHSRDVERTLKNSF